MSLRRVFRPLRVDASQKDAMREIEARTGFRCYDLHAVGNGFPDFIIAGHYCLHLVEWKEKKKGRLTERQVKFFQEWQGPPIIIGMEPEKVADLVKNRESHFHKIMMEGKR